MRTPIPCTDHSILSLAAGLLLVGCAEPPTASPPVEPPELAVTRNHFEVPFYQDADFYLTCLDEVVHYEGPGVMTADILETPSGVTVARLVFEIDPSFFVERPNGVRYYAEIPPTRPRVTQITGPASVVIVTEVAHFISADGERLVLSYHSQVVFKPNGEPAVEKFTGACP